MSSAMFSSKRGILTIRRTAGSVAISSSNISDEFVDVFETIDSGDVRALFTEESEHGGEKKLPAAIRNRYAEHLEILRTELSWNPARVARSSRTNSPFATQT